jgi:hypothetical protein
MRCERCRARIRGATWFCPECGAPVRDLNVADSVAGGRGRLALRRLLPLLMSAALLLLAGSGAWGLWRLASSLGDRFDATAATATATVVSAAVAGPTATADAPLPAGLPVRPGVPLWRLHPVGAPPLVDGLLDDWQSPLIDASPLAVEHLVFGPDAWQGVADLSATAWGAYDARALYLAVAVRDDHLSRPSAGARLYLGDSVELQLDSDLAGDVDRHVFDADDWHVGLSPGALTPGGAAPEAWAWRPQARAGALQLPLAAQARPGGYALELALPWTVLGLVPAAGLALGLTISVSDDDASEPLQETMVSSSAIRRWDDPTTMGLLLLDP